MSKVKSFLVDIIFWSSVVLGVYIVKEYWSLPSPDKWLVLWVSGYIPMFAGLFVMDFIAGVWLDEWEDFTVGMMLVLGWLFGLLMWLAGFAYYLEAKEVTGSWLSEKTREKVILAIISVYCGVFVYAVLRWIGLSYEVALVGGVLEVLVLTWVIVK